VSVSRARQRLAGSISAEVRVDEPMSRHTTYRIGGPADMFVIVETVADLGRVTETLAEEDVPYAVVGKGSNLLVADAGYRGAVLVLGREFRKHEIEGEHLKAGAGVILAALVQEAFRKGLAGMAFAVGIPGTFGGALAMNAGARGDWIGSLVESVTLYVPGKGLERVRGAEVPWAYRSSGLARRGIILEGVLKANSGEPEAIRREMERNFRERKLSQPVSQPSAGSVFKNPEGDSAGRLIEAAGLKGLKLGGARVSRQHANFIVNEEGATAADVVGLIRKVQMTVRDVHGVELRPEIRFLGRFEEPQAAE
jgi:UDP-N-acetylmuramate dehydrogenase